MDTESQKVFDQLVQMDQETLSDDQKGFLMARRSYFNDEQKKRYAGMIKLHEEGKLLSTEVALEDMSLAQLKAEAKKRKVSITGLKTAEEILEAIQESEE